MQWLEQGWKRNGDMIQWLLTVSGQVGCGNIWLSVTMFLKLSIFPCCPPTQHIETYYSWLQFGEMTQDCNINCSLL